MLTSVVRINYNSTRRPPSPAIPISALRISQPNSGFQRPASSLQFLIANLELKFRVSPIRINELKFSNRKFFAILRGVFRISSSLELQVSSLQNLIVTPKFKFSATRTKQTSSSISNRYKPRFLCPGRICGTRFSHHDEKRRSSWRPAGDAIRIEDQ